MNWNRREVLQLAAAPLLLPLTGVVEPKPWVQPACMHPGPPGELGAVGSQWRYFDIEEGHEVSAPLNKWHAVLSLRSDGSVLWLTLGCTWNVLPSDGVGGGPRLSKPNSCADFAQDQLASCLHDFQDYGAWGPVHTYGWVYSPYNTPSHHRQLDFELDPVTRRLLKISFTEKRGCLLDPGYHEHRQLPLEPLA